MLTATIMIVATNLLVTFIKKYIQPKYGAIGVHVLVFLIALGVVSVQSLMTQFLPFKLFIQDVAGLGITAIATYEILWKRLNFRNPLEM
ncbi:MAG: hypothetical protein KW793_03175 [Candidatus Doudnabacteria bacterium]|nr:hypothetical protein [Candidatus Doudnabacteria bacterium]